VTKKTPEAYSKIFGSEDDEPLRLEEGRLECKSFLDADAEGATHD